MSPVTELYLEVSGCSVFFTLFSVCTYNQPWPRSAAFPASAAEILLHICCFPPAEHSAASSWLIYQVISFFLFTKPFIPYFISDVLHLITVIFLCLSVIVFVLLCLCRCFFFCSFLLVSGPSSPGRRFSSPLPPASWDVVSNTRRVILVLHTHFSSKTGKSTCFCERSSFLFLFVFI